MTSQHEQKKPKPRIIEMKAAMSVTSATALANLLVAANLAKQWFADTVQEAERQTGDPIDAIRREIVFAVCFAESYIFEWARDLAGWQEVMVHFEPEGSDRYETVKERWKGVPARLHKAGVIDTKCEPNVDWRRMGEVTKYRNGLVHGRASIPSGLKSEEDRAPEPEPALSELRRKPRGWALAAVLDIVEQLHRQTNTPLPEYLRDRLDLREESTE